MNTDEGDFNYRGWDMDVSIDYGKECSINIHDVPMEQLTEIAYSVDSRIREINGHYRTSINIGKVEIVLFAK